MKKLTTIALLFISGICNAQQDYRSHDSSSGMSDYMSTFILISIAGIIISYVILYHIIKSATRSNDVVLELKGVNSKLIGLLESTGKTICRWCLTPLATSEPICTKCGEANNSYKGDEKSKETINDIYKGTTN